MNRSNFTAGVEQAWTVFATFVPKLLFAIVILVVGYFVVKLACRLLGGILHRVGFDRLVERGGIKRALSQTRYDASSLLARVVFYALMLFVLQFAFSVFGANPVSTLLTAVIAFLPNVFAAIAIVIVTAAIAAAAKDILQAMLAALSYGRLVANLAAAFIYATGIFAALSELNIAPAIVNGIFYAALAIIAGSAIVAVGGGGIVPMRTRWEKVLNRVEQETPRLREHLQVMPERAQETEGIGKTEIRKAA